MLPARSSSQQEAGLTCGRVDPTNGRSCDKLSTNLPNQRLCIYVAATARAGLVAGHAAPEGAAHSCHDVPPGPAALPPGCPQAFVWSLFSQAGSFTAQFRPAARSEKPGSLRGSTFARSSGERAGHPGHQPLQRPVSFAWLGAARPGNPAPLPRGSPRSWRSQASCVLNKATSSTSSRGRACRCSAALASLPPPA